MAEVEEGRKEQRVRTVLRVTLADRATGVTRDVSASGMYFETDVAYDCGSAIHFDINLDMPGGPMVLSCRGEIVRVEHRDNRLGIAVRFLESTLREAAAPSVGVLTP